MVENQNDQELDPWSLYLYAMKSPVTREKYQKRLEKFFDFVNIEGITVEEKSNVFVDLVKKEGNGWLFNQVLRFMRFQLDRFNKKEITGSTIRNYLKSIKLFCDLADFSIAWKKITRGLPKAKNYSDDRIPTIDEIRKLLEYPDRRLKSIITTMASSGIRLGAWDYLRWGNVQPIEKEGKVVAAKIIVYAGEEDEYFSFISKEAFQFLKDWMSYREFSGELIDENTWVMRDLWDIQVAQGRGFVTKPKKLAVIGIKKLINRAIWAQGLRKKLENGKKRHPFQAIHCYRKWFKTRSEMAGMKPINVEILLSHNVGISSSYYRPTEFELLDDYLKAVKNLTIFEDTNNKHLKKEIDELREKNENNEHIIKSKLQEKDDALITLSDQVMRLMEEMQQLKMSRSN